MKNNLSHTLRLSAAAATLITTGCLMFESSKGPDNDFNPSEPVITKPGTSDTTSNQPQKEAGKKELSAAELTVKSYEDAILKYPQMKLAGLTKDCYFDLSTRFNDVAEAAKSDFDCATLFLGGALDKNRTLKIKGVQKLFVSAVAVNGSLTVEGTVDGKGSVSRLWELNADSSRSFEVAGALSLSNLNFANDRWIRISQNADGSLAKTTLKGLTFEGNGELNSPILISNITNQLAANVYLQNPQVSFENVTVRNYQVMMRTGTVVDFAGVNFVSTQKYARSPYIELMETSHLLPESVVNNFANLPYYVTGSQKISTRAKIKITAGVVLKFAPKANFTTTGEDASLVAEGTASNKVTFTSQYDTSVGGDIMGTGAAAEPKAGDWGGIRVQEKNFSIGFTNLDFKFGGILIESVSNIGSLSLNGVRVFKGLLSETNTFLLINFSLPSLNFNDSIFEEIGNNFVIKNNSTDDKVITANRISIPGGAGKIFSESRFKSNSLKIEGDFATQVESCSTDPKYPGTCWKLK
jgi:hypothetical protein